MYMAHTIVIGALAAELTLLTSPVRAEDPLIPNDMRYIGQGGSVIGLDKEEPVESGKKLTRHEKHMKAPWSLKAFVTKVQPIWCSWIRTSWIHMKSRTRTTSRTH